MLMLLPREIIFVHRMGYRLVAECADGIECPILIRPMCKTLGSDRWHM